MSRKRHYERFTNRALPPSHEKSHYWFPPADSRIAQRNWDILLNTIEQTRSEYVRKLKANPNLNRSEYMFSARGPDGDELIPSPRRLDEFIQAMEQQLKLPVMPDNPTPDQLQEALTQLSSVLKPQPYRPQDQPPEDDEGEGDGDGDEDKEGDEQESKNGGGGNQQPQQKQPKPQGRQKKPAKPDKPKQQQPPQRQQQQQPQQPQQPQAPTNAPPQREEDDEDEEPNYYDDDAPEPPEMPSGARMGGGQQTYSSPEDIAFWQARNAIINLCVARTPLERPELGDEPYNLRRVVKSAYNPAMLTSIRDQLGLTVDDVYLILDTSGSVSQYAPLIASVAAAAAGIVHIYTGTEARPQRKVARSSPLAHAHDAFPEWKEQESTRPDVGIFRDFVREYQKVVHHGYVSPEMDITYEAEMAWLIEKEQPPKGSHIIIWTDTEGCGIHNPLALRALLADYKVSLMTPYTREEVVGRYCELSSYLPVTKSRDADQLSEMVEHGLEVTNNGYRTYCEVYKFLAIEIPVLFGVTDGVTFAQALRQL